jgi:hypothetical protein
MCAHLLKVATAILAAMNIYSALEYLVSAIGGGFNTRQANPYSERTGSRVMLNYACVMMPCVGRSWPKARTLGDSCMTADIHREEREK